MEAVPSMPDYYFQGVGSGAGAIAVHEAARRLLDAGVADRTPRLMLCQNALFAPLYDAWRADLGDVRTSTDAANAARCFADELTNRRPPYIAAGGVRDCITQSAGEMFLADHASARAAQDLFAVVEGIDIEPAAAVALACLRDAAATGAVPREATVLLNITGGGRGRFAREFRPEASRPVHLVSTRDLRAGVFTKDLQASFT
ncbi:pyridoxal-phosphate dependent enzyme [Actinocrispum sp. NPDC049592]|uniref:pyridoxal-phosphate dependent enzyme n=1 Tax=Actinocrispum sp. NPDC049592 TaxID=3154835 RepID=UPI0034319718